MATRTNKRPSPLGELILVRLRHLDRTQPWLAEACGVSVNAVTKWIYTGQISTRNARAAATALGVTMEELLGEPAPTSADPDKPNKNEGVLMTGSDPLMLVIQHLDPPNRQRLLELAVELLQQQAPVGAKKKSAG